MTPLHLEYPYFQDATLILIETHSTRDWLSQLEMGVDCSTPTVCHGYKQGLLGVIRLLHKSIDNFIGDAVLHGDVLHSGSERELDTGRTYQTDPSAH
eukprot:1421146-Prymnesium_polylepis.1